MNIYLFIPFYSDKNLERNKEILFCLKKNISNFFFSKIVLVSEQNCTLWRHPKLRMITVPNRPTYSDMFNTVRNVNPLGFNFLCNSDIYFHPKDVIKAIDLIQRNVFDRELILALSRWDIHSNGDVTHYGRKHSQDSWIFKGAINKNVNGNFYFGIPGCDNRIAHELMINDYLVVNPSSRIQSFHLHNSGIRNYIQSDRIPPPYYYPILL